MKDLIEKHDLFKESALSHRRFKHRDIEALLQKSSYAYDVIGQSFEKRNIYQVRFGKGKRKVLLWSQMHGDEATATMALLDIFHFLSAKNDAFDGIRQTLLQELDLYFVPMLNPDGAERFQRRTAQDIDMNRDALRLQCPESRLLKSLVQDLQPEFSFNLHDQSIHYAAGSHPVQATISFLATAFNEATEWNEVRIKSRQVISYMNEQLQAIIPNGVGRFSDEFEPRAFGDNIQKWGSSLILIESGGFGSDIEKQFIRSLNFYAILQGLYAIATQNFEKYTLADYESIPQNNRAYFDVLIQNVSIQKGGCTYNVDLGIFNEEKNEASATSFVYESVIEDMGDLSTFFGIKTIDAQGGVLKSLKEFPNLIAKHQVAHYPEEVTLGEEASFVIDYGTHQLLVINGQII